MKTKFSSSEQEYFFHRYIVHSQSYLSNKQVQFEGQDDMNFSLADFGHSKTSIHKCRMVTPSQDNLQEWPMYLLKRVSYQVQKKNKKNKSYEILDTNIKKLSQIKTEYLCYQILGKSHRVVKLIEIINQNSNNQNDKTFFYQFLKRKHDPNSKNVCFILQFCNDKNLQDRIQSTTKTLDQNDIVIYCCQIIQGLIQLKKKGILHRDLRACNIFLHNDQIKFGDFDSAFIYKESPCSNIKNGIDINTTPQEIVQLAALSDEQLEEIGNFKLFQLQQKCDIYFFGMIIFKMIYKRDYEKKFEGTDLEYLIRQKLKDGFQIPKLLSLMKMCLQSNCQKRIDLITLNEEFRQIQKNQYFLNQKVQKTYLVHEPMNLFSYNTLQNTETFIQQEIQSFISHTFTFSFVSVQHDFQYDFQKSGFIRNTKLYHESVTDLLSKRRFNNWDLWGNQSKTKQQKNTFIQQSQDFVASMSLRAFFYDKLYRVILKINTNQLAKREHRQILNSNKKIMEKQLILVLKFLFQILGRTPFKIDKHYENNLCYQVRNLFKNIVKINKKAYFYSGRAKTFNYANSNISQMISEFYNSNYEEGDVQNFHQIYLKIKTLIKNIDYHLKKLLRQCITSRQHQNDNKYNYKLQIFFIYLKLNYFSLTSLFQIISYPKQYLLHIIDLLRPYESIKKSKKSSLKQMIFTMIIMEKQQLQQIKKNDLVLLWQIIQPIFNSQVCLDKDQIQLFFQSFKKLHAQEVQNAKQKENIHTTMNLLSGISNNHLACLSSFFSQVNSARSINQKQNQQPREPFKVELDEGKKTQEGKQKPKFQYQNNVQFSKGQQQQAGMKIIVNDVSELSQGFQNFAEQRIGENKLISV